MEALADAVTGAILALQGGVGRAQPCQLKESEPILQLDRRSFRNRGDGASDADQRHVTVYMGDRMRAIIFM